MISLHHWVGQRFRTSSVNEAQFETHPSETATTPPRDSKQNGDLLNRNKLSGRFLDVEELCKVLQGDPVNSSSIPNSVKENTYFLIKNDKNVEKRKQKMRSNFEMIVEHGCQNRLQQKRLYSTVSTKRFGWSNLKTDSTARNDSGMGAT